MIKNFDIVDKPFITEYSIVQYEDPVHFISKDTDGNFVFTIRIGINQLVYGEGHQKLHIDLNAGNLRTNFITQPKPLKQGMEADIPDEERRSFSFEANYHISERSILNELGSFLRVTVFVLTASMKDNKLVPAMILNTAILFNNDEGANDK
ncbi:hypothetical protein [Pediococcus parvulus]|uniref:hypothetical protein n=1 Tax=Pediococcus parvulus TaxID=54062 RepID=UPI00345EF869